MDSSITSTVAKAHDSSNASVFVGGFWRNRLSGVYIEYEQRGLEARRDQQVLEVLVAAVVEEVDHFFISAHGTNNLSLLERPAPVPVDEAEGLASRVEELLGEFAVGRGRGPRPPLLLGLELLDALREAPVDGLLPARETTSDEQYETRWRTPCDAPLVGVDLSTLIRVQDLQGLLQPRRVEQKLQVLLAARLEELDNFLRGRTKREAVVG